MNNKFPVMITVLLVLLAGTVTLAQDRPSVHQTINLPRGQASNLPFSDAVLAGNTLYISGRIGIDFATMKPPEQPKDEAKVLLDGFKAILEQAEMTMDNMVFVTIYCPDLSLYADFNEVYRSYFQREFPARAFVGSGPLLFGGRFEMQAIAVK